MRIIVLGDSIAQGLGVKGQAYADLLGNQIINLAQSAAQIDYSYSLLPEIAALQPDIVIIAHGITEAIVRPTPAALKLIPKRWRKIGWLDPRPYFSRRFHKRCYQQSESALRWRVKVLLIRCFGGQTLGLPDDFECSLFTMTEALLRQTQAHVILLTHTGIDERFYPKSAASLERYLLCAKSAASRASSPARVSFCNVSGRLDRWSDYFADHFHPNAVGHEKIAKAIRGIITGLPL